MTAEELQDQAKAKLDQAIADLAKGRAELAVEQRVYDTKVAMLEALKNGGLAQLQSDVVAESWTLYQLRTHVDIDLVVAKKNAASAYNDAMGNLGRIAT